MIYHSQSHTTADKHFCFVLSEEKGPSLGLDVMFVNLFESLSFWSNGRSVRSSDVYPTSVCMYGWFIVSIRLKDSDTVPEPEPTVVQKTFPGPATNRSCCCRRRCRNQVLSTKESNPSPKGSSGAVKPKITHK